MKNTNNFNSILELANKFKTDLDCRKYLVEKLWNGKPVCPHCANEEICSFSDGRRYKCKTCKKQFTVTVGTIFEGSHIQLQKWFIAIYLITAHKKGISSLQLSKDICVTQKTAWYMLHRIRYAIQHKSFLAPLKNVVEVDETFVGGKDKNRHEYKKGMEKTAVFGMIERGGEVRTGTIPNCERATIFPIIQSNVAPSTQIMSDEATIYRALPSVGYSHGSVTHSLNEYVNGKIHVNGMENFWSIFKRGIIGIYHQISPKHMDKYLDEFEFRFNSRKANESERFDKMLMKSEGYLSYQELTS